MKKNFLILILIFLINGCGYEPINLSNDMNFTIEEIKIEKNNTLNSKIKKNLISYSKPNHEKISLEFKSEKAINVKSKDAKGNTLVYEMQISVNLKLKQNQKISTKSFTESFIYNNKDNLFDLKQFEKSIESNLVDKIVEKILLFLKKTK
tara:strand:+ start:690 stop:1139 length:450 start_codon:yes stop_codon:yes gene_type:complete